MIFTGKSKCFYIRAWICESSGENLPKGYKRSREYSKTRCKPTLCLWSSDKKQRQAEALPLGASATLYAPLVGFAMGGLVLTFSVIEMIWIPLRAERLLRYRWKLNKELCFLLRPS